MEGQDIEIVVKENIDVKDIKRDIKEEIEFFINNTRLFDKVSMYIETQETITIRVKNVQFQGCLIEHPDRMQTKQPTNITQHQVEHNPNIPKEPTPK